VRATQVAGRRNGRDIVPALADEPRYHARATQKEPRRIASTLALYDCINCDLCIPACPNDAMFSYEAAPVETPTERLHLTASNRLERAPGSGYTIRKAHQLAVVAGFCNQCSNCEVYCPETGAPFKVKERVFVSLADFEAAPSSDGFCRQGNGLLVRLGGTEMRFEPHPGRNRATVQGKGFRLELQWEPFEVLDGQLTDATELSIDTSLLWRMKTVWESIFHSTKANIVHTDPVAAPMEAHALRPRSGQAGGPATR
jgi:putative selenate reductase